MTNHYRNTISVAYLLFCLFISSVSARSFIQQFTDDFSTNLQREVETETIKILDVEKQNQVTSSRDYKSSASNIVKGLTNRVPSTYSIKIEFFNMLLNSTDAKTYVSRPFPVGGYNWTLVVYPNGNKYDNGTGYISLYVAIDTSTFTASQEVYADLKFYIFNNNEKKYFTIQDTDLYGFNTEKNTWGFSQVLPMDTFKDPKKGYLYDGDHCQFGVDVTVPTPFEKSEIFSVVENFDDPIFTWKILGFSMLLERYYFSETFSIGGRSWKVFMYPNGVSGDGYFSMYLTASWNEDPYFEIYVRAKLRVLNQRHLNNVEGPIDTIFRGPGYTNEANSIEGYSEFISVADLKDSSKGFIVNDSLMLQLEMESISSTKYLPS